MAHAKAMFMVVINKCKIHNIYETRKPAYYKKEKSFGICQYCPKCKLPKNIERFDSWEEGLNKYGNKGKQNGKNKKRKKKM